MQHDGEHYRLDALHLSEPSPQRTPVLYQAGTSPAGRGFAARHAECVFVSGPSKVVITPRVAAIAVSAAEVGRRLRGHPRFRAGDRDRRADRRGGSGQARRLSAIRRSRRRADADVGLDRASIFRSSTPTRSSSMSRTRPAERRSRTSRAPIRIAAGPCGRLPSTSRSAASGRSSSVRPRRSPISSKTGSTTPTSTASISPSWCDRRRSSMSPIFSFPSFSAAAATRGPIARSAARETVRQPASRP